MSSRLLPIAVAVFTVVSYPVLAYASFTSAVVGSTATMIGDAAGDLLVIEEAAGFFRHNRFGFDPGFTSNLDFDSTAPGDQTLAAATATIHITAGGGNDIIRLADGIDIRGAIEGGTEVDTLDYSAYTTTVRANLGLGTTGLSATFGADQEVPPTIHAGTGTATITNYNVATRTFDISVAVSDLLPADVTGFHIHQAVVGVNGPIIVDFTGVAPLVPAGTGFTFTAPGLTLPAGSEAAFLGGGTYVNIHTAAFPGGAIRGQLFSGGNFPVPSGFATGAVSIGNIENVIGGTAADSLVGSIGVNGIGGRSGDDWILAGPGNDIQLGEGGNDVLVWSNGDGSDINEGGADTDLVNVNGNTITGDAFLVQPDGQRLRFDRTNLGLFNLDIFGVEGLIVNGIGGDDAFTINDLAGVPWLTTVNFNGFADNDVFHLSPSAAAVNVRTLGGIGTDTLNMSAFTSAIRVNLGLGSSGLSATLGNDQENPPTAHAGTGTATITNYNVTTRTFDISVAVSDFPPGDVTGFHIHQAAAGVNGPVIVDFTGLAPLVPAGTGFTFTANGVTLPAASEAAFLGGSTYVNIHTAAFPGGAIRGQIFSGSNVNLTSGVASGVSSVVGIENITGGTGDDSLVGSIAANVIAGGAGNDWIAGGPGADTQSGEAGNDVLVWSNGDGSDVNEGGTDTDTVQVNGNVANADVFLVSANATRLRFDRTNVGFFTLDIGTVETLTVNGIGGDDTFNMNDLASVASLTALNFNGFAGNDTVNLTPASAGPISVIVQGGTGVDTLQGPNGTNIWNLMVANQGNIIGRVSLFRFIEVLSGGPAADLFNVKAFVTGTPTVNGGAGVDTLNYDAESRAVSGDLTPPDGVIDSPGVQSLTFTQIETVSTLNPQPTVTINDATGAEGGAPTTAVFNVSLSQASLLTITVNAATANGTAIAPDDYTAVTTPVTFAPGEVLKTVSVPIAVDAVAEATETFVVNLSAPVNIAIADGQGVGTIADNASPTISTIAGLSTNEDTATAIGFTVSDLETAAASLIVTAASSNTTLVPNGNIALGGSGSSRTVTVTPAANQSGTTTITISVDDGSGHTTATAFMLTVNAVNDPPTIGAIANQTISANSSTGAIAFTVDDLETATSGLTVSAISSNTTLVPNANIVIGGSGASRTITITPAPNQVGATIITVTVSDGALTGFSAFTVTVSDLTTPQPPTALYAASIVGNTVTLRWTRPALGPAPTEYVVEGGLTSTQVLASLATGSTSPIFTVAAPSGVFYVRVHALVGGARSVASNEILIYVNVPAAPSAPTSLVATVNGSAINFAWRNTFAGGSPDNQVLDVLGPASISVSLGPTDTASFPLVSAGTYNFRVRSSNGAGSSAASNDVTVTAPTPCSGAPLSPANFLAYKVGNRVHVIWDPAASGPAPTSFVVSVTGAFNGAFPMSVRSASAVVGTGLYNLSVTAVNACGTSAATAVQTVVIP